MAATIIPQTIRANRTSWGIESSISFNVRQIAMITSVLNAIEGNGHDPKAANYYQYSCYTNRPKSLLIRNFNFYSAALEADKSEWNAVYGAQYGNI